MRVRLPPTAVKYFPCLMKVHLWVPKLSVDFGKRPERGTEFLDTLLALLLEIMKVVKCT
jgi:hypothetical protein